MRLGPLLGGAISEEENRELTDFAPGLHVYDKANGELLATIDVPSNVMGAPMTYMADGKQYIVFAIGGLGADAELIAMSLP
jgi:quinoprotein glucose dehydrogenase